MNTSYNMVGLVKAAGMPYEATYYDETGAPVRASGITDAQRQVLKKYYADKEWYEHEMRRRAESPEYAAEQEALLGGYTPVAPDRPRFGGGIPDRDDALAPADPTVGIAETQPQPTAQASLLPGKQPAKPVIPRTPAPQGNPAPSSQKRIADGASGVSTIKQASKVKSDPNDPDDLATLIKKQESFEKVLNAYKKNPSKESLQRVIAHLKATAAKHPHHLNPGYYGAMFDAIDRAKEMMGRGNTLRGLATYGLAVPLESAWATLTAPETAIARAMNKERNVDSTSLEALSAADPSNIKRNARAATELHDAYVSTREDPTKQVESLMNEARRMVYTPGKGGWLAGTRVPIALAMDALSAPHTALFNSKGWNGKSRKEWEAAQEKSAAYDALMEKAAVREWF